MHSPHLERGPRTAKFHVRYIHLLPSAPQISIILTDPSPAFAIHAADDGQVLQGVDPNYYQGQIGAPSRPPSRTNNRSPLSRLVDYAADNTTGEATHNSLDGILSNHRAGNTLPPTSVEQEDAELQQAIAASVATSNMQSPQPQPQESGVADADTGLPHFGPANRSDYNQNEWAMITLNHDKPEPDPSRRKRETGAPAFLRCRSENAWETHRLGAILTILHSIPAARNALLRYGGPPPQSYGHDAEWWKGKAIAPPAVQATHEAGELAWADESKPKWSEELHRLMAFLDATERSYGTADVLADTQPEGQLSSTDSERDFFDYLRSDPDNFEHVKALITTCHLASVQDDEAPFGQSDRFGMLDFPYSKEQLILAESIYSLWDRTFFMDYRNWTGDDNGAQCALITEQAEVLTMRVTGDDGLPKPIEIPKVFYLDRYLACNRAEISKIQRQAHILAKALIRAEKAERRLTVVVDPANGKEVSRIDLNKGAIAQMKKKRALAKQWALWRIHREEKDQKGAEPQILLPPDTPDDEISWTEDEVKAIRFLEAKVLQLEDELARVEDEVAGKSSTPPRVPKHGSLLICLAAIHRERDTVIKANRELERRLTVPDKELGITPQHAYTLRGVANSVDVLYVCLPAEQDLMVLDEPDSAKAPDQWWKLGYVATDDDPVKVETTTFEKVMEEACGVGSKPILVYASDKAMREEPVPLSDALQVSKTTRCFRLTHAFEPRLTYRPPDIRPLRQPHLQERASRRGPPRHQEARGIHVSRVAVQTAEPVEQRGLDGHERRVGGRSRRRHARRALRGGGRPFRQR